MTNFSSSALLITFFVLFFLQDSSSSPFKQQKFYKFQTRFQEKFVSPNLAPVTAPLPIQDTPKSSGRVFFPIGYGADPSGAQDSSDAILNAVADALMVENDGHQLLPGVSDLGGVIIDLQGVSFKIGKPIRLPPGAGNLVIQGGTLRASDTFPGDRHLVELWSPSSVKRDTDDLEDNAQTGGIYYEDIVFRDILFDSEYRGGGLLVLDSARIRVTDCYFLHFTTQGILIQNGHETFISTCFLGEHPTIGGDRGEKDFTGTAIDLASNDNAVTDVAIFSAAIGITLRGQANIITGVHCYNKAKYFGGVGILVKAAQTRLDNCYLDFNSIVIEDPSQVHVINGFFLGGGNIVLKSIRGRISGLTIVNNMFTGNEKSTWTPIVSLDGAFSSIDQVVIDHNNVNGMSLRSTVGKMAVSGNGTEWVADFSSVLVFPNQINHVQYSFYVPGFSGGFPGHVLTNVSNNIVVVGSEKPINGVVSVVVDQHNMVGERNFFM
ncbi:hypothetical protein DCAR_0100710 [Daucus carota subsp. sativus]|uniref:Uncharacterized protein n=1 Tax=Daucus carota subsp. sativus TaxID=79200 RepID=A0A166FV59_DAUCS|nr:PREDICTED: polygalacturonase QRT3-like [Daucus carota subsp. sativus]WOG81559.1 hypothetical protein DCAR_0100710 [Daucus carota subsp. sativus]